LLAWGWQEMAFFMGFVTGPRKTGSPARRGGLRHFWHGVEVCLYHELAILASAAAIVALTWGAPNQIGVWTFMLLWAMRQSAKLNVFLGVRNLNEQFLPAHLAYLKGYLTRKPMNLLFPLSVSAGTLGLAWLVQGAAAAEPAPARAAGLSFLATMLALAVIEHWFLVLPLPFAELWNWLLRLRGTARPAIDLPHGVHPASTDMVDDGPAEGGRHRFKVRRVTAPA
jgi:putative photosynthetic complex assembly protein 2